MSNHPPGRLLTAREVGLRLGITTRAVLERWSKGDLPGFQLSRNVVRFDEEEIDAWLASRHRGPAVPALDTRGPAKMHGVNR